MGAIGDSGHSRWSRPNGNGGSVTLGTDTRGHAYRFYAFTYRLVIRYLAFGEVPNAFVWLGSVLIFGSTAFIAYREHVKRQQLNKSVRFAENARP